MPGTWSAGQIRSWGKRNRPSGAPLPALFSADKLAAFQENVIAGLFGQADDVMRDALRSQAQIERQRVLAEQTGRSGGIAPLLRQTVDGIADDTLSRVAANSTIILDWTYTPEILGRTKTALVERSPRDSGGYIEGILTFVDDEEAPIESVTVDTREVRIVATVDYARRLEVGKDASGQPWVKQVAPHIVEETAIIAKRKFGELADIEYSYVELTNAYQIKGKQFWRRRGGLLETEVRYPAIIIVPK